MALYPLLSNRACINILKEVYDKDQEKKNGFTIKLSDLNFPFPFRPDTLKLLQENKLIAYDYVEEECIISITQKGKEFIETFDNLNDVLEGKKKEKKVRLHYQLKQNEKRVLVLTHRISNEIGNDFVPLKTLTIELYPRDDESKKMSSVSRYVKDLENMNLMERKKEGRNTFVKVTDSGKRVIKEQYLHGLLHL